MEWYKLVALIVLAIGILLYLLVLISSIEHNGICTDDNLLYRNVVSAQYSRLQDNTLSIQGGTFIERMNLILRPLFKYHIGGIGMIPRWYKASKCIDKHFKAFKDDSRSITYRHAFGRDAITK